MRGGSDVGACVQRVRELLYSRTGLSFSNEKVDYIERRVRERMRAVSLDAMAAYVGRLSEDPAELQELTNLVTVNETRFFREEYHFRCLVRSLLPELLAAGQLDGHLRLWSIPCATGEEPYSMAIYLLENWPQVDGHHVDIVGSDIDTRALAVAREGLYEDNSLSNLPPLLRTKYFKRQPDGRHRLAAGLRSSVDFGHLNMTRPGDIKPLGTFHVIFCRNVLIYFDEPTRLAVMRNLYQALRPGAFLCLGHSEMLARQELDLLLRRFPDAAVYQRPGPSAPRAPTSGSPAERQRGS